MKMKCLPVIFAMLICAFSAVNGSRVLADPGGGQQFGDENWEIYGSMDDRFREAWNQVWKDGDGRTLLILLDGQASGTEKLKLLCQVIAGKYPSPHNLWAGIFDNKESLAKAIARHKYGEPLIRITQDKDAGNRWHNPSSEPVNTASAGDLLPVGVFERGPGIYRISYRGDEKKPEFTRLVDLQTPFHAQKTDKFRAFQDCILAGNILKASELAGRSNNINEENEYGWTWLTYAVRHGSPELVELLIHQGADVNHRVASRVPLLGFAVAFDNSEVIRLLITYGAEINSRDLHGNTPLILAVKDGGYINNIRLLIDAGADIAAQNNEHQTALVIARKLQKQKIVTVLQTADRK